MEQEGHLTSTGLTRWQAGNVCRVLKNSFYCGQIEYRKQYVPDYLTQKKINNHGEIEKIYVQGTHETIISVEDFEAVQQLMNSRAIQTKDGKSHGKFPAKCIWVKKVRCTCNHAMNRRSTYVAKNGEKSFIYQCYGQLHTGTPAARQKRGLSIDGVCDNKTFTEWKLEVQADFIFKKLVKNKQAIYDEALKMIEEINQITRVQSLEVDKIEANIKEIDKLKGKIAVLVDLYTEGDISKEVFKEKKQKIEEQIGKIEQQNNEYRQKTLDAEKENSTAERMERLSEFIKMKAFDEKKKIPSTVIDYYVDRIVFDKGVFTWILNPRLGNEFCDIKIDATGLKKNKHLENLVCGVNSSTGSYRK